MRYSILLFCILFTAIDCKSENDTISVALIGYGKKGEKIKLYNQDRELLYIRSKGNFKYLVKVISEKELKYGDPLSISVFFKPRFGLFYKKMKLGVYFDDRKRYLVFTRDRERKNKYAIRFSWEDEIPYVLHLKGTNIGNKDPH